MSRIRQKLCIDLALWGLAAPIAFLLRLEQSWVNYTQALLIYGVIGLFIKALLIYTFGLHRQVWHKVGVRDLYVLFQSIGLGTLVLTSVAFLLRPHLVIPRSIPILEGGLALLALGGVRLLVRVGYERERGRVNDGLARRVLIVGAGEAGTMIAREMIRHPEAGLIPVGFLDDEPSKQRQRFLGLPVMGGLEQLSGAAERTKADEILIAIPSAPGRVIRKMVEQSQKLGLRYRIIPGVYEILSGKVSISQIREVDLEDLLRREPVKLNLEEISGYLENRVVLVTRRGWLYRIGNCSSDQSLSAQANCFIGPRRE